PRRQDRCRGDRTRVARPHAHPLAPPRRHRQRGRTAGDQDRPPRALRRSLAAPTGGAHARAADRRFGRRLTGGRQLAGTRPGEPRRPPRGAESAALRDGALATVPRVRPSVTLDDIARAYSERLRLAEAVATDIVSSGYHGERWNGVAVLRLQLREEFRGHVD